MRIAICYSGQLRHCRMLINTHVNNLIIPLLSDNHELDLYFYTDCYNTTRTYAGNNQFNWSKQLVEPTQFKWIEDRLTPYFNKVKFRIENTTYPSDSYVYNIASQMKKFNNVLSMIESEYDIVIRLRPDVYFITPINLTGPSDKLYQNREDNNNYNGDSIQIFSGKYLGQIVDKLSIKISELLSYQDEYADYTKVGTYEDMINDIFKSVGLKLEWISDFVARWYKSYAIYTEAIDMKYFNDWNNLEYGYNFDVENIKNLINIRAQTSNILDMNLPDKLSIAAADPDITVNEVYKDIIGLIPCSGTATRMNGIPKFLLPCKQGNLLNNTIKEFKLAGINKIYLSITRENEHFIIPFNQDDNDIKYIVKNTKTMSETVQELTVIKSRKYILMMPDTYFDLNAKELVRMNVMLNKYQIVVILWKIKAYQYGKLGQVEIDNNGVVAIKDKDPECRYPYSWGVIGWRHTVNHLIDRDTPHIGYIINSALENAIPVGYILCDTDYYDCGTPSEYFTMIKQTT